MELTTETWAVIATAALAVSEALSLIPKVKSNGVFQLVINILKNITGKGSKDETLD